MAGEDDLVIRILREIQGTLADHGKTLDDHTHRFEHLERRLDEVNEGMVTALGLAGHAHVRHESLQRQLDEMKLRIERLEEKV